MYNDGVDNDEYDLIIKVDDEIQSPFNKYKIIDILGKGVSGQVFCCNRESDNKLFAIKIIRNKVAYSTQALIELKILEILNFQIDPKDEYHIIRKHEHFIFKKHTCIIFELLDLNLLDLLKKNHFSGLTLKTISYLIKDVLEAVYQLHKINIIHTDIKPENVLLKIEKEDNTNKITVKLTDFGSSCYKNNTFCKYIQSRYYRSPEVLIGVPYGLSIDIWSVGCIAAELFIGSPIFAGVCEYDQLFQIVTFFKEIPYYFIKGDKAKKYMEFNEKGFRFKNSEQYFSVLFNY
jgi:dual specificity protein kinase YAK1